MEAQIQAVKIHSGKSYNQIAEETGLTNVYVAQLLKRQAQLKPETAPKLKAALPELNDEMIKVMMHPPLRSYDPNLIQEPTVYRWISPLIFYFFKDFFFFSKILFILWFLFLNLICLCSFNCDFNCRILIGNLNRSRLELVLASLDVWGINQWFWVWFYLFCSQVLWPEQFKVILGVICKIFLTI